MELALEWLALVGKFFADNALEFLTFVLACATGVLAWITWKAYAQERKAEVVASFELDKDRTQGIRFVVENVGRGTARNVRISIPKSNGILLHTENEELKKYGWLSLHGKEIPIIKSGGRMSTFAFTALDVNCEESTPFNVVVSWTDFKGKTVERTSVVSVNHFWNLYLDPNYLMEISQSLKKMEEVLSRFSFSDYNALMHPHRVMQRRRDRRFIAKQRERER